MKKRTAIVWIVFFVIILVGVAITMEDIMFSKPTIQSGVIIEMVHVPKKIVTADIAYSRVRTRDYFIEAQKDDQWIAIVRDANGEEVIVHCNENHYKTKNVGEVIQYKKYEGQHLHIKYFSHNEEL